jgi:hypothetical protein
MSPIRILRTLLVAAAVAVLATAAARANDRALLRTGSGQPYVFILFDNSGSMNWAPKCTAEQVAAGICTFLCPNGDCPVPRDGDDPSSKFRQAKEALYEVLKTIDVPIQFGFANYNQDRLAVTWKEWLYRVQPTQAGGFIPLLDGSSFPQASTDSVFGATFACDQGNGDAEIGCYANGDRAADTDDVWEMTKVRRLPKLGDTPGTTVVYYIRSGGQVYRVQTDNPTGSSQALGDAVLSLRTRVFHCTGTPADNPSDGCNAVSEYSLISDGDKVITYDRIGDFVKWDYGVQRDPQQGGYDGVTLSTATNTCAGWDPNDDTTADRYPNNSGYDLRYPNGTLLFDPAGTTDDWMFQVGDVVPMVWTSDNKSEVLKRLAPRLAGGDPATDPEAFADATYLNDHRSGSDTFLRLRNENDRPFLPNGSTPLGYALGTMRTWFRGCLNGVCPGTTGWDDIAAANDPDWECRHKYLLVITDGDDTCPGRDPCSLTASMHALDDITTYVVAFGVENTAGNRLNCMASNGGSGDPIYPQNKQELVDALTAIFGEIQEQTVAFASAAVPTVQANIADKVYLSSFTPLNAEAIWPGRLDAFLKPLPLDANNLPDRTQLCDATHQSQCYAWDAGDSQPAYDGETGYAPRGLLLQAPVASGIVLNDNTTLKLGTGADERRVFFGIPDNATAPGKRQWFRFPADAAEQLEYEYAWSLPIPDPAPPANLNTINDIVKFTLEQKRGEIDNPDDPTNPFHIQYVLGDIFHSNPVVLNPPNDFDLYTQDLYWNTPLCGQSLDQTRARRPQVSYDWFSNRSLCRRIMLFVGSDDGQLHVFDGGIFRGTDCKLPLPADGGPGVFRGDNNFSDSTGLVGNYDYGTGRELFSFIPGQQMPLIKTLSEITELTTQYGVDGTSRVADVFIDPQLDAMGLPTCDQRQWRTVLFGTYREGGPGVFALDITQPDTIDADSHVPQPGAGSPGYVPSCTNGGANCGNIPFPSVLWEFKDTGDEDGVGGADEANSWSRPVIARLKVCDHACDSADEPEDRWVAIFGGGLPDNPVNSAADTKGNWLYIVDVETGRILYKRGGAGVISGSVAADVTVVDTNYNGLVDTLYFGTTAGLVYKVDLGEGPFELGDDGRIQDPSGETGKYNPFVVFTTLDTSTLQVRPIYLEISAVYVPQLRANALLFGTGSRWNLWDFSGTTGRFFAIVDTGWHDTDHNGILDPLGCGTCSEPLTEASFEAIDPDASFTLDSPGPNYLFGNPDPNKLPGWYFTLSANDKLITEPFALSGITFFTVYAPISSEADHVCALGGESKIFTVNTANAAGYAVAAGTTTYTRYVTAPKFTTQPYTEQSATGNQGGGTGPNADQWTDELRLINAELKKLFPADCRFANYTLDIKTIRSDTGIVFIAPVPICIEGHNWKEY